MVSGFLPGLWEDGGVLKWWGDIGGAGLGQEEEFSSGHIPTGMPVRHPVEGEDTHRMDFESGVQRRGHRLGIPFGEWSAHGWRVSSEME
jgi:hypothetical protein